MNTSGKGVAGGAVDSGLRDPAKPCFAKHNRPGSSSSTIELPGLLNAATEEHAEATDKSPAGPTCSTVHFQGADIGDEQVADAYHARGSMEAWKAAVGPALPYPAVRLRLLASLEAPMLAVLADEGARNFTVDNCGDSSKGKTTVLRIAASVWGWPQEDRRASVITTWQATRVGAERRAGLANGIPIIRDDTKLAKRPEYVSQVIYDMTEGRSAERGTVKGLGRTTSFSTVMLSSDNCSSLSATTRIPDETTSSRVVRDN